MFHLFVLFCLCWRCPTGVFGDDEVTSVSVMEGESVLLHSDVTDIAVTALAPQSPSGPSVSLIVPISAAAASAGSLLIVAVVGIFCIYRKCRKTVHTQEDRTDSALCKPTTRKKKPKTEAVYENVRKKR